MGDTPHNEEWQQLLSAFADGECDAHERKLATDHLRTCERCRTWLRQANSDQEAFVRSLDSSARTSRHTCTPSFSGIIQSITAR